MDTIAPLDGFIVEDCSEKPSAAPEGLSFRMVSPVGKIYKFFVEELKEKMTWKSFIENNILIGYSLKGYYLVYGLGT